MLFILFYFIGNLKNEDKVLSWLVEQKSKKHFLAFTNISFTGLIYLLNSLGFFYIYTYIFESANKSLGLTDIYLIFILILFF